MRKVHEIAKEILHIIQGRQLRDRKTPGWVWSSLPYLKAMCYLNTPADRYGLEYGDMIILYCLNNLHNWRGEDARRIKAELKDMLEEYNAQGVR